jgi:hypothetical protein
MTGTWPGVGVPAAPIKGLHEQPSGPLPFRMLSHDRLQGGDGILRDSQRQQQFSPAFPRYHTELVEPDGFGLRERPAGEFRESGTAPQVKSLIERSFTRTSSGPSSPYPQPAIVTSSGLLQGSHMPARSATERRHAGDTPVTG